MLETLDYTIRIASTPTFLYFDLYLYSAYAAHFVYLHHYIRLAELVLTLNNFSFDGEHYQQISGVAMGTKMGANLFVGYVEQQILEQYTGTILDFFWQIH